MKEAEMMKLINTKDFEFIIDTEAAMVSQTIHNMLTLPDGFTEAQYDKVTFLEISTSILEKICQYLFMIAFKSETYKCSICGSKFSSGQALGGHIRQHQSVSISNSPYAKKEQNLLSLDLNLPVPSKNDYGSEFSFLGKQLEIFLASPLVDCYY